MMKEIREVNVAVVGHYARSDVFQLTVNESPLLPVITKSDLDTGEVG